MKMPKLSRNQWIFCVAMLVLTGRIAYYFWSHWGLVTVHSKGDSLAKVIKSIEHQGHVTIKTNMDLTKPVVMNVDEVSLAEAMETLSVTTDSRWRLAYFVGPDKTAVATAIDNFTAGQKTKSEGWRSLYIGVPPVGEEPLVMPDPRNDLWVVKPAKDNTLQSYLEEAAKNVAATFLVPENFNPGVKSAPKTGGISSAMSKLASSANAKYVEVFLLQGSTRTADRGDRDRGDDDGEPRFAGNFGGDRNRGFDRSAFEERIQNEINKLPPSERVAAQQEHDQRKAFFDSLKDLSPDERASRIQQMMQDPTMQDKMDAAKNARDGRQAPQQRLQHAQNYLQKMAAAKGIGGN